MGTSRGCSSRAVLFYVAVVGALAPGASASEWQQRDELPAPSAPYNGEFGACLRMSGDYAVVGDPHDDAGGAAAGAAYVLRREGDTWTRQGKLTASDAAMYRAFGQAVAIDGDYVLVGAEGGAYVFVRNGATWSQQAKLTPAEGAADDFGVSVSLDGNCALVGASNDTLNGVRSGSAFVFVRNGTVWTQQARLAPADGTDGDWFGQSLCLRGDCAIIGAPWDDTDGTESGSAYVFIREGTTWTQQARLAPASAYSRGFDHFASDVFIDGDYALLGTSFYYASTGSIDTWVRSEKEAITAAAYVGGGAAYVFQRNGTTWTEQAKLVPTGDSSNAFGCAVALQGDYAVVGDPGDHVNARESGSAYVFRRDGTSWIQQAKIAAADGQASDWFGQTIGISGDSILVGAPNGQADDNGAVYVFSCKVPVHRFWSASLGRHFYTTSESEKAKLINAYGNIWAYEGAAYQAYTTQFDNTLAPVYRFWSQGLSAHFYTIKEAERDKLIERFPTIWTYEGIAFYAYPPGAQPFGARPVYRFWSPTQSAHFYTVDAAERDKLLSRFSTVWTYEDIAWYAPQ